MSLAPLDAASRMRWTVFSAVALALSQTGSAWTAQTLKGGMDGVVIAENMSWTNRCGNWIGDPFTQGPRRSEFMKSCVVSAVHRLVLAGQLE